MKLAAWRLSAAFIAAATLIANTDAGACSCADPPPAKLLEKASFVIRGIVLEREAPSPRPHVVDGDTLATMITSSLDMVRYRMQVTAVWKGEVADDETVYSRNGSASCGLPLAVGDECLLFLRPHDGQLSSPIPEKPLWAGNPEFPAKTFGLCDGSSLIEHKGTRVEHAAKMLAFLGAPLRTIEASKPDSTR